MKTKPYTGEATFVLYLALILLCCTMATCAVHYAREADLAADRWLQDQLRVERLRF